MIWLSNDSAGWEPMQTTLLLRAASLFSRQGWNPGRASALPVEQPACRTSRQIPLFWLVVALLWSAYIAIAFFVATQTSIGSNAYSAYHQAAQAVIDGHALYTGLDGWVYLYPPLLAQALTPIVALRSYEAAISLWFMLNISLLLASVALLARYVPLRARRWLWLSPMLFLPVWQALVLGQVTIVLLALLTGVWVALREQRPALAGSLLALAAWIKVFPAVLLLLFAWHRNWRLLAGTIVTGLMLLLVQIVISGPATLVGFIRTLFDLIQNGQPAANYENLSLFAFLSRLFAENQFVDPLLISPSLLSISRLVSLVGIVGITGYAIVRAQKRQPASGIGWRSELQYALVIVTVLLMGSTLWVSGLPPLLLVYVLILRHQNQLARPRLINWWCGLTFWLITLHQPIVLLLTSNTRDADPLLLSGGFFGVLLLWVLLIRLLLTLPSTDTIAPPVLHSRRARRAA